MDILGKRFYYKLSKTDYGVKSLMDSYRLEDLLESLVIAYNVPSKFYNERYEKMREKTYLAERANTNDIVKIESLDKRFNERSNRMFSIFNDYFEFKNFLKNFEPLDRCFHEIIPGDARQKMRYDIDMKNVTLEFAEFVKDDLLTACYETFQELCGVTLMINQDILIYTSHSEQKMSYHVIIDNYYFRDHNECKKVYNYTISKLSDRSYSCFIDHAVYSSMQSFRIVNCTKLGQDRFKILNEQFSFRGQIINHEFTTKGFYENLVLAHSLISYTHDCTFLKTKTLFEKVYTNYGDLSQHVIDQIEEKMSHGNFRVRKDGINGNIVNLDKTEVYYCEICKDNHHSENPYLVVENENVYWFCRRARKRMFFFFVDNSYNIEDGDNEPLFNDTFYDFEESEFNESEPFMNFSIQNNEIVNPSFMNTIKHIDIIKSQTHINPLDYSYQQNFQQNYNIIDIPDKDVKCKMRRKFNN